MVKRSKAARTSVSSMVDQIVGFGKRDASLAFSFVDQVNKDVKVQDELEKYFVNCICASIGSLSPIKTSATKRKQHPLPQGNLAIAPPIEQHIFRKDASAVHWPVTTVHFFDKFAHLSLTNIEPKVTFRVTSCVGATAGHRRLPSRLPNLLHQERKLHTCTLKEGM